MIRQTVKIFMGKEGNEIKGIKMDLPSVKVPNNSFHFRSICIIEQQKEERAGGYSIKCLLGMYKILGLIFSITKTRGKSIKCKAT